MNNATNFQIIISRIVIIWNNYGTGLPHIGNNYYVNNYLINLELIRHNVIMFSTDNVKIILK